MKELGFFIDREGKISFFGEYVEKYDPKNRHQIHDSSFIDEIEKKPYFKSLNLNYNKERGIFGKAIEFSLQGMIMLLNITDKNITKMHMYAPKNLSFLQKQSLKELYSLLQTFSEVKIITPSTEIIDKKDIFTSIEDYFKTYQIDLVDCLNK